MDFKLFDSHAHLNDDAFEEDRDAVIRMCFDTNIVAFVEIGYSQKTSIQAVELASKYPNIYATVGAHPEECNGDVDLSFVRNLARENKVVAIGEIGLDYHYDNTNKEMQKKHFIEQINIANEMSLPVSIHSRDADMDMLKILKENEIKSGFVMHCFSSSAEIAKEILKLDGYISLAGSVTFKNARNLLEVAKIVPNDKLLIETDSPYLSPEPNRGKRNTPSNVIHTCKKVAEIRGESVEHIAKITCENAQEFYKIFLNL